VLQSTVLSFCILTDGDKVDIIIPASSKELRTASKSNVVKMSSFRRSITLSHDAKVLKQVMGFFLAHAATMTVQLVLSKVP